jgi:tetratricopeptide (TPR) repeat protein
MASVFLSYDRDDADIAPPIASALEKAGHSVWWDKHISGGSQFSKEIEHALDKADVVVVVWTRFSVESPWVRDEAGAGRDRGRLIPLSLEGTLPPLGFRQFQSIDLGGWQGRGKVPHLKEILAAIERLSKDSATPVTVAETPRKSRRLGPSLNVWAAIAVSIGIFFVIIGLLIGRPWERGSSGAPTVAVVPADASPASRAMAREVLATIGTLQANSATNFGLIEHQSGNQPDLTVSVGTGEGTSQGQGTVALSSSRDKSVVWSRQIHQPVGNHADLEQAVAYAAMTALSCAASSSGGASALRASDLRAFLNACVSAEEAADSESLVSVFRRTTNAAPKFAPAWANLLLAQVDVLSAATEGSEAAEPLRSTIRRDVDSARKVDPNMPQAIIADIHLQPSRAFLASMSSIDKAITANPDNPALLGERSLQLSNVGREEEALRDAERAASLMPYSLALRERYILLLASSGGVDKARAELAKARQLWPDAPSLASTEVALDLRYGDFEKTWRAAGLPIDGGISGYFKILRDPSDANIDAWINLAKTHEMLHPHRIFILQTLGPLKRVDQLYQFLDQWPIDKDLDGITYLLFRPWMANVRRDPRFMRLAKRVGLLDYWEESGAWPDFCAEPDMPYDCKKEAAKLKA